MKKSAKCGTVGCSHAASAYIPDLAKHSCAECTATLHSQEEADGLPDLYIASHSLGYAQFLLEQASDLVSTHHMDNDWKDLEEEYEQFDLKLQELLENFPTNPDSKEIWSLTKECKTFVNCLKKSDIMERFFNYKMYFQYITQRPEDCMTPSQLYLSRKSSKTSSVFSKSDRKLRKRDLKTLHKSEEKRFLPYWREQEVIKQNEKIKTELQDTISTKQKSIDLLKKFKTKFETKTRGVVRNLNMDLPIEEKKVPSSLCDQSLDTDPLSKEQICIDSYKPLEEILTHFWKGPISIDSDFSLMLNCNWTHDSINLMEELSKIVLPKIDMVNIYYVNKLSLKRNNDEVQTLNKFLKKSIPKGLVNFKFNQNDMETSYPFNFFDVSLQSVARKVVNNYELSYCNLKQKQFESIVLAGRNCKKIIFNNCTIESTYPCNFTGIDTGILDSDYDSEKESKLMFEELDFRYSGRSERSKWNEEIERFENIIIGLQQAQGLHRFKRINIHKCGISQEAALDVLETHGFENVEVIGGDDK
ncbi:unnamed protein product [Moneuplotes crassus]|uniref:Uncharacterized protein n=1 Tax=Euplotes crassus TaxID=5936 RepID=A0AAD1UE23_EUPCR|nr:unnamed protein product [Moneuplotes crassus]